MEGKNQSSKELPKDQLCIIKASQAILVLEIWVSIKGRLGTWVMLQHIV
jgi:hypothetical protein